ncbi:MAG: hypothetical protein DRO39_09525 [Thermoprotei archaeon]|nr:MAG: hypothetical protein DRO39_09525 [Thermoprotei archaeon]
MSRRDQDYALQPVPLAARLSTVASVLVWASLTLDPSAPYLAMWWASSFGLATLTAAVLLANLVLSVFSSLSAYIASREGVTYALAAENVFGTRGVVIPSLWAGFVAVGWLAFSIGVVADTLSGILGSGPTAYYALAAALTLLFSTTAYMGIRHIARLAYVGVPTLAVMILLGVVLSVQRFGAPPLGTPSLGSLPLAATLVLGTFVNGAITLSFDYQRFCRSPRDASIVSFANFLGFWSFVILFTALPAAASGKDLIATYSALGLAPLAAFTLFLLAWTSADNQLYSSSLSWSVAARALRKPVDRRSLVLVGAAVTILLSFTRLHTFAVQWLSLMTVVSLPAGIVVWTDYYIVRRGWGSGTGVNIPGFLAWFVGSVTIYALLGTWYGTLLGFLATFLTYIALAWVGRG